MEDNTELYKTVEWIYNSCKIHREKGEHVKFMNYFNIAMKLLKLDISNCKIGKNYEDNIEYLILIYKLLEEFTIISYYTNDKDFGLLISDKLLFDKNNLLNKTLISRNQKFYMKQLQSINKKKIDMIPDKNYVGMNPSIIKRNEGYLMNFRTSNFGLRPGGVYYCRSDDGIIDTINYILELDNDFNILSKKKVIDNSKTKTYSRNIKGLEDLIIFFFNDQLWGTCTLLDVNQIGTPQIGLCHLELSGDNSEYIINTKLPFKLISNNRPEKNWLPFVGGDELKLVYGYTPTEIITPVDKLEDMHKEIDHISYIKLTNHETILNFDRFRGSAGPLRFNSGWLIIVHEVSWNFDNSRVYTHRFIFLDAEFIILKISDPWYFESHGIEFCRSMCDSHTLNEIIITCGIKDEEGWCYTITHEYVNSMLKNLCHYEL